MDRFTREDTAKAIEYLREALVLDPEYALAWAELGRIRTREAGMGWVQPEEGWRRAREAAERALSREPDLAEGHATLAYILLYYDWDWRGAEASMRRALELAPGNASVLRQASTVADTLGHVEEAIVLCRRAVEQDPLSAGTYFNFGRLLYAADRLAEAEAVYRKVLELAPQRALTRAFCSLVLLALDRAEEALAEAMREPDEPYRLWALAIVHHNLGRGAESDEALRELIEKDAEAGAYQIAEIHAARGETDAAFEWLERAYTQRDGGLTEVKRSPLLRSLHGDPRWGAFLTKMRLEE
jgi:tetratricopeptide (TPR) repeat protein